MFCSWRTSDLALFLIWMVFSVADSNSSCVEEMQRTQNNSPLPEVNTTLSVLMGAQALLCCPLIPSGKVVIITWKVNSRGQPSCNIAYHVENKTSNTTCTDRRITWVSTPDQSPHLQISTVDITHDGHYTCDIANPNGNFQRSYALQVLDVKNLGSYVPYITPPIVILIIIGSIWFFKICGFRKCKLKKPEGTPNVEEEEMQPYASYTEKSNPLYDTVSKVEALQVSQGEVDSTGLHTVSGPEPLHQEK